MDRFSNQILNFDEDRLHTHRLNFGGYGHPKNGYHT